MGAVAELLAVLFGDAPILLHLAFVAFACFGIYALHRSGMRAIALMLLVLAIALDPILLLLRYLIKGYNVAETLTYYVDNLSFYLSPWIVVGILSLIGKGLVALSQRNLKWLSILILCSALFANAILMRIVGVDRFYSFFQLGWGLEYGGLITPMIFIGIFSILPLKNLTPPQNRAFFPIGVRLGIMGLIIGLYTLLPLHGSRYFQAIAASTGIHAIALYGLNILTGLCGQISFAQWALVGIGAYTAALLDMHTGVPLLLAIPFAGLFTAFSGAILGLLSFMKNFWLGSLSILFASVVVFIFTTAVDITGGPSGIMISKTNHSLIYYLIGFVLVLSMGFTEFVKKSEFGRKMIAIREADFSAFRDTYFTKIKAFALSGLFAGIAGGLYSCHLRFINPGSFEMHEAVMSVCILIMGGMGTTIGPLISTIAVHVGLELLRPLPVLRGIPIVCFVVAFVFLYWFIYRIYPGREMRPRSG